MTTPYSRKLDLPKEKPEQPKDAIDARALLNIVNEKAAKEKADKERKIKEAEEAAKKNAPQIFAGHLEIINKILQRAAEAGRTYIIDKEAKQMFKADIRDLTAHRVYQMLIEHFENMSFLVKTMSDYADDDDKNGRTYNICYFELYWSKEDIEKEEKRKKDEDLMDLAFDDEPDGAMPAKFPKVRDSRPLARTLEDGDPELEALLSAIKEKP